MESSRDPIDLPSTCHPSPSLTTFALGNETYGKGEATRIGSGFLWFHWSIGCFLFFLKWTADVLAPRLAVVFRRPLRLGSIPVCWRVANDTPIPNGPSSSSVANYRPISLTPTLSKVFERLVSVRLFAFYGMQSCASNHPVRL